MADNVEFDFIMSTSKDARYRKRVAALATGVVVDLTAAKVVTLGKTAYLKRSVKDHWNFT